MAIIYLCIGTMKTGSSALQNFMLDNTGPLKEQGFCYPIINTKQIRKMKNRNGHFLIHQTDSKNDDILQFGYHELEKLAKTYPNIILSEELLWHHSRKSKDFWPDLLDKLKEINCTLKVIVYLRRQDQLIESLWKQGVKIGVRISHSFKDYVRLKRYRYFPLDYYSHLKKIEKAIGKENLIVRVYEKGQYEGEEHTLISDFMHTLGIRLTDDFIVENEIKNPSLSGNFLEMKRILNSIPEYKDMPDFMLRSIVSASVFHEKNSPAPKQSLFHHEDQVAFLNNYTESNRKVAEEFLGREDGILFREPVASLPVYQIDPETIYQDILTFTAKMFCQQQQAINALEAKINKKGKSRLSHLYHKLRSTFLHIFKSKEEMV